MEVFKQIVNAVSSPAILFTVILASFFFIFPPTAGLARINKRLGLDKLWTKLGALVMFGVVILFFALGLTDDNFRLIVTKPDNVPIVALVFLVLFFLWFAMYQARQNDQRIADGHPPLEASAGDDKVLVWPDLVYIEFISLILMAALLIVWSLVLKAPLEEPANPTISPNPSKAPWYFLGLQEMLVYFDPWLAGVILPTFIIIGLIAIPFIDPNEDGTGYYSFQQRRTGVSMFLFGFLALWVFLIIVGTFLRGPNWNFYGPFEIWDPNKRVVANNVNLSEYIYIFLIGSGMPRSILLRELWGILLILGYFMTLPPLLARTVLKSWYDKMGVVKYSVTIVLLLTALSLPLKMYARWLFNLKYIVSIPEFFFNI